MSDLVAKLREIRASPFRERHRATITQAADEVERLRANHKDVVATKRITDARLRIALAALQKIYDESCEDNITLIAGEAFEEATHETPRSHQTQGQR